MEDIGKYKI